MQGSRGSLNLKDWVLIPGLVTLAVTIVRLLGEFAEGPSILFGAGPGGGASLVGIVWLVFVFGGYFGYQLARQGFRPASAGRTVVWLLLALVVVVAGAVLGSLFQTSPWVQFPLVGLFSVVAVYVARRPWPEAGGVLTAYGLVARIPVAIVMLPAIMGQWGTHYDAPPPGFPADVGPLATWVLIGLIPQLTIWIAFTNIMGGLAALVGAAVAKRP